MCMQIEDSGLKEWGLNENLKVRFLVLAHYNWFWIV